MKQLHLAIRNRKKNTEASNVIIGDKIYVSLYIPTIHKRKNMSFKKFVNDLNYYILLEYICAKSDDEGFWNKSFCAPYNCKCMKITNKIMELMK